MNYFSFKIADTVPSTIGNRKAQCILLPIWNKQTNSYMSIPLIIQDKQQRLGRGRRPFKLKELILTSFASNILQQFTKKTVSVVPLFSGRLHPFSQVNGSFLRPKEKSSQCYFQTTSKMMTYPTRQQETVSVLGILLMESDPTRSPLNSNTQFFNLQYYYENIRTSFEQNKMFRSALFHGLEPCNWPKQGAGIKN